MRNVVFRIQGYKPKVHDVTVLLSQDAAEKFEVEAGLSAPREINQVHN